MVPRSGRFFGRNQRLQPLPGNPFPVFIQSQHGKLSDLPVHEDVQLNGVASPGNTSRSSPVRPKLARCGRKEPAQLIEPNPSTLAGTPRLFQHCKSDTCHPTIKKTIHCVPSLRPKLFSNPNLTQISTVAAIEAKTVLQRNTWLSDKRRYLSLTAD